MAYWKQFEYELTLASTSTRPGVLQLYRGLAVKFVRGQKTTALLTQYDAPKASLCHLHSRTTITAWGPQQAFLGNIVLSPLLPSSTDSVSVRSDISARTGGLGFESRRYLRHGEANSMRIRVDIICRRQNSHFIFIMAVIK